LAAAPQFAPATRDGLPAVAIGVDPTAMKRSLID
jgi:hypothetical protein